MPYPFTVKTLLPNYREFDDARHFFSLQKLARELGVATESLLSPVHLAVHGTTYSVGCLLCEDGWSDDYGLSPMKILREKDLPDFFVNISSSPYTLGKNDKRHRVFSQVAAEAGAPFLYVNNIGIQNNGKTVYTFDGANAAYDAHGVLRLSGAPYEETAQVFDLETLPDRKPVAIPDEPEAAHIFRALSYGVRLFLETIGMKRVVIGVSGGIDSAVAAALYARVLPPENLLLVNMPSVYNSETTKGLARRLAENLGCRYTTVPIQPSVELTAQQIVFRFPPSWRKTSRRATVLPVSSPDWQRPSAAASPATPTKRKPRSATRHCTATRAVSFPRWPTFGNIRSTISPVI